MDSCFEGSSTSTPVSTAAPHRFNFERLQLLPDDSTLNSSGQESAYLRKADLFESGRGEAIASHALATVPVNWQDQGANNLCMGAKDQPSPIQLEESAFKFGDAYSSPSRIPRPRPGYKRQHRRPASGDGSQQSAQKRAGRSRAERHKHSSSISPMTPGPAVGDDTSPSLASISELTDEFGQLTCRQSYRPPNLLGWTPSNRFLLSPAFKKLKADPSEWWDMTAYHQPSFRPGGGLYSYPQASNPSPCARLNFDGSPKKRPSGRQPRKAAAKPLYEFDPDLEITKGGYLDMSDPETPESEDSGKCSSKSSLSKDLKGEAGNQYISSLNLKMRWLNSSEKDSNFM